MRAAAIGCQLRIYRAELFLVACSIQFSVAASMLSTVGYQVVANTVFGMLDRY